LGIEGPHLMNQLNGGVSVDYGVPIRPGDVITSVTRLGQYSEREGSLGLMLFTPLETAWTNQRGEVVKQTRLTLIRY
jgi:N-terminal half of MaoC dehydratase